MSTLLMSSAPPVVDDATRRIDHDLGSTEVPSDPQGVFVAEGRRHLEIALALDLPVVGTGTSDGTGERSSIPSAVRDRIGADVEIVASAPGELNLEAIAALRPDLVLSPSYVLADGVFEQASEIAPTLPVTIEDPGPRLPWREALTADWLGREQAAQAALVEYDSAVEQFRARYADAIANVELSIFQPGGTESFIASTMLSTTVLDVGGRLVPAQCDVADTLTVSNEETDPFHGDVIIRSICGPEPGTEQLDASPLWQQVDAVRTGRVLDVDVFEVNFGPAHRARLPRRARPRL